MTRRVDTDDLVYGVRGPVEDVSGVRCHSITAPKVAVGTAENARRAGTAVRAHRNAHDVTNISVSHQHVSLPVERGSMRAEQPKTRRHWGTHNAARSWGRRAF